MVALGRPLASLNLENHVAKKSGAQIKSRGLSVAEKLVSVVVAMEPDVYRLFGECFANRISPITDFFVRFPQTLFKSRGLDKKKNSRRNPWLP